MPNFRKKPVVIEARLYECLTYADSYELAGWCGGFVRTSEGIVIPTLEGEMIASPGDWIIKGIKGEFYPCKPDIFEATYEAVDNA